MSDRPLWIEVFLEHPSQGEVVMLLRYRTSGIYEIINPHRPGLGVVVATFNTYDEAKTWFTDEEFDLVEGRWMIE